MCYNGNDKGRQKRIEDHLEQILKHYLSPNCRLQFAGMKLESLVIVDQHATVNTDMGFVHTARHIPEVYLSLKFYINVLKP